MTTLSVSPIYIVLAAIVGGVLGVALSSYFFELSKIRLEKKKIRLNYIVNAHQKYQHLLSETDEYLISVFNTLECVPDWIANKAIKKKDLLNFLDDWFKSLGPLDKRSVLHRFILEIKTNPFLPKLDAEKYSEIFNKLVLVEDGARITLGELHHYLRELPGDDAVKKVEKADEFLRRIKELERGFDTAFSNYRSFTSETTARVNELVAKEVN
jgi:hypothetical protein